MTRAFYHLKLYRINNNMNMNELITKRNEAYIRSFKMSLEIIDHFEQLIEQMKNNHITTSVETQTETSVETPVETPKTVKIVKHKNIFVRYLANDIPAYVVYNKGRYFKTFKTLEEAVAIRDSLISERRSVKAN